MTESGERERADEVEHLVRQCVRGRYTVREAIQAAFEAGRGQAPFKVSPSTIVHEARGLMKTACRIIWAREHGLRVGRDDSNDASVYVMRLAHALGLLPEINGAEFRDFCETLTGLSWEPLPAPPDSGDANKK